MKAARIHRFGAPDVVVVEEVARPAPAEGELLIRVAASGVGPWDALIREGKSKVSPPPPLTLGSDLSGVVEEAGPSVSEFKKGDQAPAGCVHQWARVAHGRTRMIVFPLRRSVGFKAAT